MRIFVLLLLLFASQYDVYSFQNKQQVSIAAGKYRISPKTGALIAIPTLEQLQWQAQELAVIIHFNMGTYVGGGGCSGQTVPNITLFKPYLLNTDNWVQSIIDFGAKHAVLVAKHVCGFFTAPTDVKFPLSPSGEIIPYNYSINYSPMKGRDVLGEFVKSCEQKQIKTGFYYSVVANAWLNIVRGSVQHRILKPGQVNVTEATYEGIVLQQLKEIWSRYGNLTEIWFDGGYMISLKNPLTALLAQLQPHATVFNGYGISPNPIRWVGNEWGVAPDPNWSTGTRGSGDPDSPIFCPAECDTTLQNRDRWFWSPDPTLRSLSDLIQVYHQSVGRNCLLMLDLAPDQTGLIPPAHAARYKELGDFIRSCYGTSISPSQRLTLDDSNIHILLFNVSPATVDRSVIQEDQTQGQVIRAYTIEVQLTNSTDPSLWNIVAQGTSVGNKKIDIWQLGPQLVNAVRLTITKSLDTPVIKAFTLHLCN